MVFAVPQRIVEETNRVLLAAGPRGHILNVGHGVVQGTPESAVGVFCEAARRSGALFASQQGHAAAAAAAASKQLVSV
jgi:uroporphyrinogen-III decarboxylase